MIEPFIRHSSEVVLKTPIFSLRRDRAEHPRTRHVGDYYVLENPDWVNVVALTAEGELILVRQWRHGAAGVELELTAGLVEPGEDPLRTAARELREETGYEPERVTLLGRAHPNAAYQQNTIYTVLAEGCRLAGETHFDAGEDIEVVKVPRSAVPDLVRKGELRSAMVLAALLFWLETQGLVDWARL